MGGAHWFQRRRDVATLAPTTTTSPSTSVSERMPEVPGALRFGRRSILGLPSRANSPLHKITKSPADSLCVHGRETTEERRSADQAACSPASLNIKFFRSVWRRCRFTGRHAAAWTTRRENTTYAYFGARTASSRISRKPQAARWDTSTTSATASATTGFNLGTVEYKTISFAVLRRRPVRVAPL